MVIRVTKEGKYIMFQTAERDTPIKFDCKDMKLISFTGRTIKTVPQIFRYDGFRAIECVCNAVIEYVKAAHKNEQYLMDEYAKDIHRYEPFIPYLDKVQDFPEECPKGYIKWILATNSQISYRSLNRFKREQEALKLYKSLSEIDRQTIKLIRTHYEQDGETEVLERLFTLNGKQMHLVSKVFRVSMKSLCWNLDYVFRFFINNVTGRYDEFPREWDNYIDTNRNFDYNIKNLKVLKLKEQEKDIIAMEDKIRPITALSNNRFTIIVPDCLEQFTDEGNQQNNCVGSYYHESIAEGRNIIYFIRKTENPEKSFTTCRYNVYDGETVEHRIINNGWQNDTEVLELIYKIDKQIRQLLSE